MSVGTVMKTYVQPDTPDSPTLPLRDWTQHPFHLYTFTSRTSRIENGGTGEDICLYRFPLVKCKPDIKILVNGFTYQEFGSRG